MAFRTWAKLLLSALGFGALAGAGQLGFAYGLDIVRFARAFDAAAATRWTAQLAWVTWFATVAAVVGAVTGRRLARRHGHPAAGVGARLAFAGAAALGATAVAPLCMLPGAGAGRLGRPGAGDRTVRRPRGRSRLLRIGCRADPSRRSAGMSPR